MPTCKLTKKTLSEILLHVSCLPFLRTHHDYFFRGGFKKCAIKIFFRKYEQKLVLLVIYLFNCDWSKSTFFMLNMAFGFVLSTVFVKQVGSYCNTLQRLQKPSSFLNLCFDMYYFLIKSKLFSIMGKTFLFRFDICIKHTVSAISHFQKSHLMFELRYKTIFYMIKIS